MLFLIQNASFKIARRNALQGFSSLVFLLLFSAFTAFGQKQDSTKVIDLQPFTVTATMATNATPMTFTNVQKAQIRRNDFAQDVPYLLKTTPSVVETSDAGTGIGYTGLRVRGSDASRTNITLDGVPINDSESQLTYWVNMPDLVNSVSTIQIQRGVGTSTNGSGAFGATINLATAPNTERGVRYDGTVGSFGTYRNSLSFSSGILRNGLSVDGRLSGINSDGFVDRASARLGSSFISVALLKKRTSVRLKIINGQERTYQSWYGVPYDFQNDATKRSFNFAGTEKAGEPYQNQVDDYGQRHIHLTLNHSFSTDWQLSATAHYTRGKGFYEEYQAAEPLKKYFPNRQDTSDLVRQLWLDNHFYGSIFSLKYKKNRLENTLGGGWNQYVGDHYGNVVWAEKEVSFEQAKPRFYENNAVKTDFNIYNKTNFELVPMALHGYLDLQYRKITHHTEGVNRRLTDIGRHLNFDFFNPKVGLVYFLSASGRRAPEFSENKIYASFGVAHREPNRNDLIDGFVNQLPQPEQLLNTEIGWRKQTGKILLGANFYSMEYKNQLVITGQINDVGEQLRVNVPLSSRRGVELEMAWQATNKLTFNANATFSQNKIKNFTEYRDNWDTWGQDTILHGTTDLALSPNTITNAELTYSVFKNDRHELSLTPSLKYVSKQYLDNTSNENTTLAAYNFTNFQVYYRLNRFKFLKNITAKLLINNVFDQRYTNNGWTYRFSSAGFDPRGSDPFARLENGNAYNLSGFFPQAGRHWLLSLSVGF
jgi:iron complex outermembrane recepter protein